MFNKVNANQPNNYIDVFNESSPNFLIRYFGTSTFPEIIAEFTSLPFRSGQDLSTFFPDYAAFTLLTIQAYNPNTRSWFNIFSTHFSFPGKFCFSVSGTLASPQVSQIPCPNQKSLITSMC